MSYSTTGVTRRGKLLGTRTILVAGWSRIVLGGVAIVGLPIVYPGLVEVRWIIAAYCVVALGLQALIWKDIGGRARAIVGGVIDMSLVTLIVHQVGSQATMLISIYFFGVIVNALVVGRKMGIGLAVLGALMYCGVVVAEGVGLLPYGPAAPSWAATPPPRFDAFVAVSLNASLLVASAFIVGVLITRIREREGELRDLAATLEELSSKDPLTKLYNRRHLMARLERELARVRRGHPLAAIMIDLDRFKRVNDEHGHQRGDEILEDIAAAIEEATREVDVPGRYGGDEFVVLLPDTPPPSAVQVAERLVAAVREAGERFDAELPVTASVGLAFAREDDEARGLIQRADQHAYAAKQAGGDRVSQEEILPAWDEGGESDVRPSRRALS